MSGAMLLGRIRLCCRETERYRILYNRLLEEYLSDSVDVSQAEKDLAVMQTDGSWKDIDYKTVTFYFDAERHLKRLKNMALAYSKPGNKLFHEQELRKENNSWVRLFPDS